LLSLGRPRHLRRSIFVRHGHHPSVFLRPFAPRALPRFHATMDALTPARPVLRSQSRRERRPCAGQVSLRHPTRPSPHSVANHLSPPSVASRLERGVLPTPRASVWPSPVPSGLSATTGRITFVLLRTTGSPPVASHPASRRRSYLRLAGASFSRERTCTARIAPIRRRTRGDRPVALPRRSGGCR
jgi:hypothetical protein